MSLLKVNTVETSLLQNTGGTGSPAIREMPAFHVTRATSNQSVTSSSITKVQFNSVVFDTNSWWDQSNFRYTPQIAGYYYFFSTVYCQGSGITGIESFLYKNGTRTIDGPYIISASTTDLITAPVQGMLYLNGTTDYAEAYGLTNGTSPAFNSASGTLFSGFLVRPD